MHAVLAAESAARDESRGPGSYLTSKSTRDCRLTDRHAPHIRVPAPVKLSTGSTSDAVCSREYETPVTWPRRVALDSRKPITARQKRNLARAVASRPLFDGVTF